MGLAMLSLEDKINTFIQNNIDELPAWVVKFFSWPYIAGDSPEKTIHKAEKLLRDGKHSTIDVLGEFSRSLQNVAEYVNLYNSTFNLIAQMNVRPTASFKPSCFTPVRTVQESRHEKVIIERTDLELCENNIRAQVRRAKDLGIMVTIDMEDHHWTDFTLNTYFKLREEGFDNVGSVLQARLFRTAEDVRRFGAGDRVRLCIGIYNEPPSIAVEPNNKKEMKERLINYLPTLFENDVYVEIATHDTNLIDRIFQEVIFPMGIPPERFETQFLLGVQLNRFQKALISGDYFKRFRSSGFDNSLVEEYIEKGVKVRIYLPFAQSWDDALPYCRRRIKANPNIARYGIKNFLRRPEVMPRIIYEMLKERK
ncbi:hypothetical protein D6745_05595 [Candidatus Woesearchaeota archaeon]|nr:MAG: hypothetical protein D6745_05595 [Candidatus Woesearchaeota archaeon]